MGVDLRRLSEEKLNNNVGRMGWRFMSIVALVATMFVVLVFCPMIFEFFLSAKYGKIISEWQSWYGVLIGFLGAFIFANHQIEQKKRNDQLNLLFILYCEVYDRAARCVLDATTWSDFYKDGAKIDLSRFRKFRPQDPVIFPANASNLSLVPSKIVSNLMVFYFRLDAIRRDVDKNPNMIKEYNNYQGGKNVIAEYLDPSEVRLFSNRLQEIAKPALETLNSIGLYINDLKEIDEELRNSHMDYEFLKNQSLSDALRKLIK